MGGWLGGGVDAEVKTEGRRRGVCKGRPDMPIEQTKVKIKVCVDDMVNIDQVVVTDGEVSYEWVTPGHDWAETGTEVLDVTYLRRKQSEEAPGGAIGNQPEDVPDSVEKAKLASRKPAKAAELLPTSESGRRP